MTTELNYPTSQANKTLDNTNPRVEIIKQRLQTALLPTQLEIFDESHAHRNHAEARQSGGGHFKVCVVSAAFEQKSTVARHRLVYQALEGLIGPEIHAIQIVAKTPEE